MSVEPLTARIADHSAVVGVVGLGYVGLPFAVEKTKVGFRVIGVDGMAERVHQVNRGESYIGDVDSTELRAAVDAGLIEAVTDFDRVAEMDVIVVAVPTPLTKNLTPDLQYVERVSRAIAPHLRAGQLVCLESTTYPGTTDEVMRPILDESGLKADVDYFLAHSPERVDPGNQRYTTKNTTKVVGGIGPRSLEVAVAFYSETISQVVPVSSAKAAELVKVFENTFRAVNIALVNELTLLCDRMDLSVWEVLDAAFTKPFGIMPFYPGPGVGGHCIPLDPHYLEWKAREYNFTTRFVALAGEINRRMPEFVRDKTVRLLGGRGVAASKAHIFVLGVSNKLDLDDWRESPALEVIDLFEREGMEVSFHDPYVSEFQHAGATHHSTDLTHAALAEADLVVILTDHTSIDYTDVVRSSRHVFDTRNATKSVDAATKTGRVTVL
jgi:UDP-N-acetyl-D-glucosamine dehydrogenase